MSATRVHHFSGRRILGFLYARAHYAHGGSVGLEVPGERRLRPDAKDPRRKHWDFGQYPLDAQGQRTALARALAWTVLDQEPYSMSARNWYKANEELAYSAGIRLAVRKLRELDVLDRVDLQEGT